jgi:uncharacterized protein YdaU (DUF1376 family)
MKHYPHHIGDFDRATRHLTRIERSIYRDLIDLYYDTEQPLTLDREKLCRRILARSNEESTAVEQVLNEFFTETQNGWYHVRCEDEIEAYRANNSQRAMAGKASAEAKRLKKIQALNGNSTPVERSLKSVETNDNGASTNQSTNQPINHQPSTTHCASVLKPGDVCKAMKRAGIGDVNPGNQTLRTLIDAGATMDEFVGAAQKAAEGRKGFAYALGIVRGGREQAAAMVDKLHRGELPAAETTYQRSMRERMAEAAPMFAKPPPGAPPAVHPSQAADYFLELAAMQRQKPPSLEIEQ